LAIAGCEALRANNLEILAENIGNKRHGRINFTDFHLVAANDVDILKNTMEFSKKSSDRARNYSNNAQKNDCLQSNCNPAKQYLTMIAVTPQVDRSGLLAEILNQVAYYNLNSAKIHSRPALDDISTDLDPQMFYLELMCHKSDPDFIHCIHAIRYRLTPKGRDIEVVRILGSYPRPNLH
jgi:prephenate dehydratase